MNDDEAFGQVAKELASGQKDEALWLKAFASENGDGAKSKAHYIRLRVEQLKGKATSTNSCPPEEGSSEIRSLGISRRAKLLLLLSIVVASLFVAKGYVKSGTRLKVEAPGTQQPKPSEPNVDPIEEMRRAGIYVNGPSISINGEITNATAKQFDYAMKLMPKEDSISVFLNSPGGDLYAAMAIGRTIRKAEQTVAVAVMDDAKCYSACVFILAGGEQRIRRGSIGIHRPYSAAPSSDARQSEQWFAKISADSKTYLREMRVREALYDDMVNISPDNILIFKSTAEMDRYGLIKMDPVVEEQIASVWMRKYGISDRSILMQRKASADRACVGDFQFEGRNYTHQECFDAFMSGQLSLR